MKELSLADSQPPKPMDTSVVFEWRQVNAGVAKFPRVLNKIKQLVARHVFKDQADIVSDTFRFNVKAEVDTNTVNDRLSRLMSKVLAQMGDDLDVGLQLSLHKTAVDSRLEMCT